MDDNQMMKMSSSNELTIEIDDDEEKWQAGSSIHVLRVDNVCVIMNEDLVYLRTIRTANLDMDDSNDDYDDGNHFLTDLLQKHDVYYFDVLDISKLDFYCDFHSCRQFE